MTSNSLVHFPHKHIHVQLLYQMDHELLRSSIKVLAISMPKFRAQFRFLKRLFSCCETKMVMHVYLIPIFRLRSSHAYDCVHERVLLYMCNAS